MQYNRIAEHDRRNLDFVKDLRNMLLQHKNNFSPVQQQLQEFLAQYNKLNQREIVLQQQISQLISVQENFILPKLVDQHIKRQKLLINKQFFDSIHTLADRYQNLQNFPYEKQSEFFKSLKNSLQQNVQVMLNKIQSEMQDTIWKLEYEELLKIANFVKQLGNFKSFREQLYRCRKLNVSISITPMINQINYTIDIDIGQFYQFLLQSILLHVSHQYQFIKHFQSQENDFRQLIRFVCQPVYESFTKINISIRSKALKIVQIHSIAQQLITIKPKFQQALGQIDTLDNLIQNCTAMLHKQLKEKQEEYCLTKFNIFSLQNYDFIKQNFIQVVGRIKSCKLIQNFITAEEMVQPFIKLQQSRSINSSNKSIAIFNINLCRIYIDNSQGLDLKVQNKTFRDHFIQILEKCLSILSDMNFQTFKQKYSGEKDEKKDFINLVQLCNFPNNRKQLVGQASLLISKVDAECLKEKLKILLREPYQQAIKNIFQKLNPSSQQVRNKCDQLKVNAQRFGKYESSLKVLSFEDLFI